ncbi:hypothetical protein PY365_27425 [Roseiarcaceae bacterium H3SJ34-1]|uniref:hypothetical protein n=1 Tax=Terripilifer ovatus TaxID=3032367 RepID=UPI003AB9783F|nr:hypothetical protein [Roseiarcaceae bacterium H3SJ34-1]
MKNLLLSTLIGLGALYTPNIAAAAEQTAPTVLAQVDVQVGPGGVRIGEDRYRDRDRWRGERRRDFDRGRFYEGRFEGRRERCRTTIIQRETPYGMRTRRIRECG